MLSEDLRNLARRFETHEGGPLQLDAMWVEHFAVTLRDLADAAAHLEAVPVHPDLRPIPRQHAGANVIPFPATVRRRWGKNPEGAA